MIRKLKRLSKDELVRIFGTATAEDMRVTGKTDDEQVGQKMLRVLEEAITKLKPHLERITETIDIRTEYNPEGCWRYCPRRGLILMEAGDGKTLCIAPDGTLFTVSVCREHNFGPGASSVKYWHYFPVENNCKPGYFPFAGLYAALNEKFTEISRRQISGMSSAEEQILALDALLDARDYRSSRVRPIAN